MSIVNPENKPGNEAVHTGSGTEAEPVIRHRSKTVMRTAAVFFIISAVFEGFSITAEVPLFGALRGGSIAVIYHVVYVCLFIAMGLVLWTGYDRGFRFMLGSTIFYSLDKLIYAFDHRALQEDFQRSLQAYEGMIELMAESPSGWILSMPTLVSVLAWWGFLFYLFLRRDYFSRFVENTEPE